MAQSSPVTGGVSAVLASQYNELRDDVLSSTLGHEHLGGSAQGNQIPTGGLEDLAVTAAKLGGSAVITDKIDALAVTAAKLGGSAVTTDKIDADAVTLTKIPNRTRKFLVPPHHETEPSGVVYSLMGARMPDAVSTDTYGYFMVPEDFVSGMTVKAVVIAYASTGNARLYLEASYGACSESYLATTDGGTLTDENLATINIQYCVKSLSLDFVAKGDFVHIYLQRAGAHANDTVGDNVYLTGFLVEYTADS